jgi:hypothetical protein
LRPRDRELEIALLLWHSSSVSLTEIKDAVETLSPRELAELASFIREREDAAWDRQIDEDFAENGRLRPVLEEVGKNIRAGRRPGQDDWLKS